MNVDAFDIFGINVACDMRTLLENEHRLAGCLRLLCYNCAVKTGTDNKTIDHLISPEFICFFSQYVLYHLSTSHHTTAATSVTAPAHTPQVI